jgi:hypothetical protein
VRLFVLTNFDGEQKIPPKNQEGFVYQGTTYVPLRFVAESLGKEVEWDQETLSIYVGKKPDVAGIIPIIDITDVKNVPGTIAERPKQYLFPANPNEKETFSGN